MKQTPRTMTVSLPVVATSVRYPVVTALALSLGAAIALGLSRFSYGLLLPSMREDLGWSYLLAGSMNTCNAVGYLIGALSTPMLMRRLGVWPVLILGSTVAGLFMLVSGMVTDVTALFLQRVCAGVASAFAFIAGGVLSARLGVMHRERAGLLIGLYYGGTGLGIALSALLVPAALLAGQERLVAHAWQWPWLALGFACLICAAIMAAPAKAIGAVSVAQKGSQSHFSARDFRFGLGSYFMFGMGYIGYMTFVVALLKQQGMRADLINVFYVLLGLAVVASSRIWASMLDKFRGGESLSILNGLLCVAAILPALTSLVPVVFISGVVFGGVFLSVVASTTALVRHNLPQEAWAAGISTFTTVFAMGQIAGPTMVGWITDATGSLEHGLIASSVLLLIGAMLAWCQRPLVST